MLDVLVISEVNFFTDEKAFLHADAEIGDSFDLFAFGSIADGELRYPDAVDIFLLILYNVVEDNIEEDKEFHSH